jgi:hypothetical protein
MNLISSIIRPSLPILGFLLAFNIFYLGFRVFQKKSLQAQAQSKRIEGIAGNSLATEKMRIRATARAKGLEGELGVAGVLEDLADKYGFVVLHDLSMPGTTANIDHLVVQQSAVFVIDAKNYKGTVNIKKDPSGRNQLYVGGQRRTQIALKLKKYSVQIEEHLRENGIEVRVVPLLAFYDAKFHKDSKYVIEGVMVNVSGIENELLRFAVKKGQAIDTGEVADLILSKFPPKA